MKIQAWHEGMSVEDTKNLAYWERNMLALYYADGWYNDDVENPANEAGLSRVEKLPRYQGWRRVLTLEGGRMTFHIPDDFDVGDLPQVEPNWDGHTTVEKWERVAHFRGVEVER